MDLKLTVLTTTGPRNIPMKFKEVARRFFHTIGFILVMPCCFAMLIVLIIPCILLWLTAFLYKPSCFACRSLIEGVLYGFNCMLEFFFIVSDFFECEINIV